MFKIVICFDHRAQTNKHDHKCFVYVTSLCFFKLFIESWISWIRVFCTYIVSVVILKCCTSTFLFKYKIISISFINYYLFDIRIKLCSFLTSVILSKIFNQLLLLSKKKKKIMTRKYKPGN